MALADASVFSNGGRWWMFAEASEGRHDTLRFYMADHLAGDWSEHPHSPLVAGDASSARPAGRVATVNGRPIRFAQDCRQSYGSEVHAFAVTELSPERYVERSLRDGPVLSGSGSGWNSRGMHHIDAHQLGEDRWLACVDGFREARSYRLKY
jgi:hypothetical protein